MDKINLLQPDTFKKTSLEKTIQDRRSIRSFTDKPLTKEEISKLMWAAQGITDEADDLRATPSSGATYPLEVYYIEKSGAYHYNPQEHSLELVKEEDLQEELASASLGQDFIHCIPPVSDWCSMWYTMCSEGSDPSPKGEQAIGL